MTLDEMKLAIALAGLPQNWDPKYRVATNGKGMNRPPERQADAIRSKQADHPHATDSDKSRIRLPIRL